MTSSSFPAVNHTRSKQSAFSLIEVLVTLAISITGLIGLAATQIHANRSVMDTVNRNHAIWILNDLHNRIRANSAEISHYHTGGQSLSCDTQPQYYCADYYAGSHQQADDCSSAELAAFDLWDVICSSNDENKTNTVVFDSPANILPSPELDVLVEGDVVILKLSWLNRMQSRNAQGGISYLGAPENGDYRVSLSMEFSP